MNIDTHYAIGNHCENFIRAQIDQGYFKSAGDVVRAGLHLLEQQAAKLKELRDMIAVGEADLAAGRCTFYGTPEALTAAVLARSCEEYGLFTPEP
jgi:antitoxin ParD1/3/4